MRYFLRGAGNRIYRVREQYVSTKVVAAINSINKQRHHARVYRHQDKMWVEIDQCMLASFSEIEELVDGVHSFEELADLFKKRHAKELGEL
jgi:expansin (peptidoglycan-binding protein)